MRSAISQLNSFLSADQVSDSLTDRERLGRDWAFREGCAGLALFPQSEADVQKIICWALKAGLPLVPVGGRTGLSGGAASLNGEIAVSFERMNRILHFTPSERAVEVQPGLVTKDLKDFAAEKSLFFPLSFAAEGSSQIGGNIATNAGGAHVLRYGSMRERVLGLNVVTGRGELLKLGRGLIKDNTGPRLTDIFIGSEGTLGFVTQALLRLEKPPSAARTFFLSLPSLDFFSVLLQKFTKRTRPLAFEALDDKGLEYSLQKTGASFPLAERAAYYLLIETEQEEEAEALAVFEEAVQEGAVLDGAVGQSASQNRSLWALRENISEALASRSPYKNDVSVRPSLISPFLKELEALFQERRNKGFELIWFGHIGDGNLHINTLKPEDGSREDFLENCKKFNEELFALIQKFGGSISAEHGAGLLKKPYLSYSRSAEEIFYMKHIKKLFDPKNILNPGKIFDSADSLGRDC